MQSQCRRELLWLCRSIQVNSTKWPLLLSVKPLSARPLVFFFNAVYADRCLVEGGGDVAFIKHTTVGENSGGESPTCFRLNRLSYKIFTYPLCPCCFVKVTLQSGPEM